MNKKDKKGNVDEELSNENQFENNGFDNNKI